MYKNVQKSLRYGRLIGLIVLLNAQPSVLLGSVDDCYVGLYPSSTDLARKERVCRSIIIHVGDLYRCKSAISGTYGPGEGKDYKVFFPGQNECLMWSRDCPTCDAGGKPVKH